MYEYASSSTTAGENDGIVCFTVLYRTITETVDNETYEDRDFLVRLDLEFARRYFRALRRYASDRGSAPRPWRLLFDARSDPDIERVQFAAAGVNAHINYDLADALLATWEDFRPNAARQRDFGKVNDVFDAGESSEADIQEDIEFALIQMKAETLQKINEALARLEDGKYGFCFECGDEIAEQRLRALPFAVRCKDCEEAREVAEQRERSSQRRGSSSLFYDMSS